MHQAILCCETVVRPFITYECNVRIRLFDCRDLQVPAPRRVALRRTQNFQVRWCAMNVLSRRIALVRDGDLDMTFTWHKFYGSTYRMAEPLSLWIPVNTRYYVTTSTVWKIIEHPYSSYSGLASSALLASKSAESTWTSHRHRWCIPAGAGSNTGTMQHCDKRATDSTWHKYDTWYDMVMSHVCHGHVIVIKFFCRCLLELDPLAFKKAAPTPQDSGRVTSLGVRMHCDAQSSHSQCCDKKGKHAQAKDRKRWQRKKTVFSYFCSLLFVSWEQQLPITSHTVTGSEPFQTLSPTWLLALHRTTSLLSSRICKDTCQDIPAKCAVNTRNSSTYALLTTSYSIVAAAMRLRLVWLHQIKVWSTEVNGSQRRKLPSKNSSAVAPTSQTTTLTPNHGVKAKSPKKWRDFTWFYYSIPSHLTCAKETLYGALPAKLL